MRVYLIAVGNQMPAWVDQGFEEYARRMPPQCRIELKSQRAIKRPRGADLIRIAQTEGERLLDAVPRGANVIALERTGRSMNTQKLARHLGDWLQVGQDIAFLVGGPEGLSKACLESAQDCWSLSDLTLAHPVVRVVWAEQIYRAWTLLSGHPYHRGEPSGSQS